VKKLKWWGLVGLVTTGIVLSGCGGSNDSSDTASVRLANATITHPSLDLLAASAVAVSGTTTDTISAYVSPASGSSTTFQLNDAGGSTALATTVPTLTAGSAYTLLAYESSGVVKTAWLSENYDTPTSGTAQVRIYNAAADAGKLDVYITSTSTVLSSAVSPTTNFITGTVPYTNTLSAISPGTYRVRVTGYGDQSDLRLDIPSITLTNQENLMIVLTPAAGGILLNGSTLIQQSTYAATRNTNARVRLAAAVSGGATVAASAGSTVIDGGSVSPAFGTYALVPASSALNITVNSASVGAPATTLTAGNDYTLLVYGPAGSAAASLITDDNRPPTDTTTTKLRMINGITGSSGALTLTVNGSVVGSTIASGAVSTYVSVAGSTTAMSMILYSSAVSGVYYTNSTSNILNANAVYTVLVGGDVSAPQLLIRK
jgi:hypothetical protein